MNKRFGSPPKDRKEYVAQLGRNLVTTHGKKKFYTIIEVVNADREIEYTSQQEIPWWGIAVFCSYQEFKEMYESEFDEKMEDLEKSYMQLKLEALGEFVVQEITEQVIVGTLESLDPSHLNIETAWFELEGVSDTIFEGLGDFFGSILDLSLIHI